MQVARRSRGLSLKSDGTSWRLIPLPRRSATDESWDRLYNSQKGRKEKKDR